jgi:flap endonuclease-1
LSTCRQRYREAFGDELPRLRRLYLEPDVTDDYAVAPRAHDLDGVVRFLCDERAFGRERLMAALERAFSRRLF